MNRFIEYRRPDPDDNPTYGRPSVSSWIAAAAVALAVFMMGGFIKTYRQLETLKTETKQEIADLKQQVERLREPVRAGRRRPGSGRRGRADAPRHRDEAVPTASPSPSPSAPTVAPAVASVRPPVRDGRLAPGLEDETGRITYEFGRKSASAASSRSAARREQCQVIAADSQHNRVMVEGGRNLGLGKGSRLELSRDGKWIADLRVVAVYDAMSACEVLHATLGPEPGDLVRNVEGKM